MDVSCVIVTRGNVDLTAILESLPFDDVVIWDNSKRENLHVFGRYAALRECKHNVVYTQDDDCICPAAEIVDAWQDGLLVNVPPGEWPWLAWGAVFDKHLPRLAFEQYRDLHPSDDYVHPDFVWWSDVVFAHMTGWQTIDLGHQDMPWATAPDRMYMQPNHYHDQQIVRDRCTVHA